MTPTCSAQAVSGHRLDLPVLQPTGSHAATFFLQKGVFLGVAHSHTNTGTSLVLTSEESSSEFMPAQVTPCKHPLLRPRKAVDILCGDFYLSSLGPHPDTLPGQNSLES